MGDVEDGQTASCATFYTNLCALDAGTITQMIDLPPGAPPPPLAPLSDDMLINVSNVYASDQNGALSDDARVRCTDASAQFAPRTECTAVGVGWDPPWLLFELDTNHAVEVEVRAVEIYLAETASPATPPNPALPPPPPHPPSSAASANDAKSEPTTATSTLATGRALMPNGSYESNGRMLRVGRY